MEKFKFIDLFCGIGGFHQALKTLGGTCVFASDIDSDCRKTYESNYGITPAGDITKVNEYEIPDHDLLCGGFPCQAFSKAGKRLGFDDPTKGTLFFDIMRIVKAKKPKYILLENVRNLASHDKGNTWKIIYQSISDAGYNVSSEPTIFSPHMIGIPQHRERVFIMAVRKDIEELPKFVFNRDNNKSCSIYSILEDDESVDCKYRISDDEIALLEHWNKFIQNVRTVEGKLPSFPIWTECFISGFWATVDDSYPNWKRDIMRKNYLLYDNNREFIDAWLKNGKDNVKLFFGAKAKFEWQAGVNDSNPDIFKNIIQIRPSGIRVKVGTYFPALVAIAQIPIVGAKKRMLTPRECARLQSFPDTFLYDEKEHQAYKQFGNSVNVDVVKLFAEFLMNLNNTREQYSWKTQYQTENALF